MNVGEAVAGQGIFRPKDQMMDFMRSYQFGAGIKAQRDEKKQRELEEFDKLAHVYPDASKYSSPLYGVAEQKARDFANDSYRKYQEQGKKYLRSNEFYQAKNKLKFELGDLQRESEKHFDDIKLAHEGKAVFDPEYQRIIQRGNTDEYLAYKNSPLGFAVDQNYRSNARGIPNVDLPSIYEKALNDQSLYTEKGERVNLAGGEGFFNFRIPQSYIAEVSKNIASDPKNLEYVVMTQGKELEPKVKALQLEARNNGVFLNEQAAYQAVARDWISGQLMKQRDARAIPKGYSIPQKSDGDGGDYAPGVSDINQNSFLTKLKIYNKDTGEFVREDVVDVESAGGFTTPPITASVSTSSGVRRLGGEKVNTPDVNKATYGDFQVVPVYRSGLKEKHKGGEDLSGSIVPKEQVASEAAKGYVEYKPMAIGSYKETKTVPKTGGSRGETKEVSEDVAIYRPMSEIEGALLSTGTKGEKAKKRANYEKLKQLAEQKNQGLTSFKSGGEQDDNITPDEFNKKWATLAKGQSLTGPDGKIYTKK